MTVGRKRTTNPDDLPPGVRPIGGRYYYEPTTQKERAERRTAKLPATVPLGSDLETARRKWAELMGYAEPQEDAKAGTCTELFDLYRDKAIPRRRRNGKYRLADVTRKAYKRQLELLRKRYGARRYARTEVDAARGPGYLTTLDIQQWLDQADAPIETNRQFGLLRNVFKWGRRWGLTFYNPCLGALPNEENPRDREALPWEYEVLLACASAPMSLILRHVRICAWREGDARLLHRFQLKADGIYLRQSKRGARQLWEWSPQLRALVDEALERPEAKRGQHLKENANYVYVSRKGTPLTMGGFQSNWKRLVQRTNRLLSASCEGWPEEHVPQIKGLVFYDFRAESIGKADNPTAFAGHSDPRTTKRHYLRSPTRLKPHER